MKQWKRAVATLVAGAIALVVVMSVTGMGPQVALVVAVTVLLGAVCWAVSDLVRIAVGSSGLPSAEAPTPVARVDRRVMRLRSGLAYGRTDRESLDRLRENLVELIDDQLLAVHLIDRAVDPATAHAVLGDALSTFVQDPDTARLLDKPRYLTTTVTLIEQL
jgi:hypothetical protein